MDDMTPIKKPWVIAHETDEDKLQVILAGPEDLTFNPGAWGIVLGDIIGHVANHLGVSRDEIMSHIKTENEHPTAALKRITNG